MNIRLGLLLCGLFSLLLQQGDTSDRWYADSFQIKLVDSFGTPVPFKVAEFKDRRGDRPDRSQEFRGGQLRHVYSGAYRYRLVPEDGYLPAEGTVDVDVQKYEKNNFGNLSLLVVEAKRDLGISQSKQVGMLLEGVLIGLPASSPDQTWVTLLDPYIGEAVTEAPVDETGHFAFGNILARGNFVLEVCQSDRVLAAQPVRIAMASPASSPTIQVRIKIPATQPTDPVRPTRPQPPVSNTLTVKLFPIIGLSLFLVLLAGGVAWRWSRKKNTN